MYFFYPSHGRQETSKESSGRYQELSLPFTMRRMPDSVIGRMWSNTRHSVQFVDAMNWGRVVDWLLWSVLGWTEYACLLVRYAWGHPWRPIAPNYIPLPSRRSCNLLRHKCSCLREKLLALNVRNYLIRHVHVIMSCRTGVWKCKDRNFGGRWLHR